MSPHREQECTPVERAVPCQPTSVLLLHHPPLERAMQSWTVRAVEAQPRLLDTAAHQWPCSLRNKKRRTNGSTCVKATIGGVATQPEEQAAPVPHAAGRRARVTRQQEVPPAIAAQGQLHGEGQGNTQLPEHDDAGGGRLGGRHRVLAATEAEVRAHLGQRQRQDVR